jgi:hypothetical protein
MGRIFTHVKKKGKRCKYREPDKNNIEEVFLLGLGSFIYWDEKDLIFIPYDFIRACYNFSLNSVAKIFGVSMSLLKKYFTKPTRQHLATASVFPDEFRLRMSKFAFWPSSKIDSADKEMLLEKRHELRNIHASSPSLMKFLDNMMHFE